MPLTRKTGCLIFPITLDDDPDWTVGPLPASLLWPSSAHQAGSSDEPARLNYFESRIAQTLYGGTAEPLRWHRGSTKPWEGDTILLAAEVLRAPAACGPSSGLAVLHVLFGPDPVGELAGLVDLSASARGSANRRGYVEALPEGVRIPESVRRAFTIAHVTFGEEPVGPMSPVYRSWSPTDQWLWCLASATSEATFPPDPDDHELFRGRVRFSADWQALVLRDGIAFVGSTPDPGDMDTFHAAAQTYVHSLYLDVMLLGAMQVSAINRLANRIANVDVQDLRSGQLVALEESLIEIRRAFGRDNVTTHGKGNELLGNYLDQWRIPALRARLIDDLDDSARFVDAANGRTLNAVLGLFSVLGLPFGLAYAAGVLWSAAGSRGFAEWTGVAIALALATTTLPQVRGMLRAIRGKID